MSSEPVAYSAHKSVVHEFVASVRRVGPITSLLALAGRVVDLAFDWRYGLDTARRVELSELDLDGDSATRGTRYQATGVWAFRRMFRSVRMPEPAVFIDYGCGKGQALVLACLEGVESVVGIEFSKELCEVAEKNVRAIQERLHDKTQIRIVCADATKYEYVGNENIFYLFYPFDEVIMRGVLSDIVRSVEELPREAVIVRYSPFRHPACVLDESELFELERTSMVFGNECRIYRHRI